ncbi:hypothetical protein P3T36_000481 [Kitasatospora sp. MAP12-15]|uniref:hypothetical protein n=1 Tax=unclassified Kitasatospora TaxID=2633591 RepID=UPI002476030D|nr:hypothetical protein [Kitasatospora sp. MAP12-44]MDH6109710.1 hypothetical protein [Kitasatospora sp. MAP12-44]
MLNVVWEAFAKQASQPDTLSIARTVVAKQGYTIWLAQDNFNVIGGHTTGATTDVVVSVSCVPVGAGSGIQAGSWVCVSAYSPDEPTAKTACDTVHQQILSTVSFD